MSCVVLHKTMLINIGISSSSDISLLATLSTLNELLIVSFTFYSSLVDEIMWTTCVSQGLNMVVEISYFR